VELTTHQPDKLRINCGCWQNLMPGYVNIDFQETAKDCEHGDDILIHDLTEGIPCGDGDACEVRADQFIEHLTLEQIVAFLEECARVLCMDGELRIEFQDIERAAEGPLDSHYVKDLDASVYGVPDELIMLNLLTHEWGHQCILNLRLVLPMVQKHFAIVHAANYGRNAFIIARKVV